MEAMSTTWADGSVSYEITMATAAELSALTAATDANAWVAANATVTPSTAPPPPALPASDPAKQQAWADAVTFAQALPANLTQAQADAQTLTGLTAGQPMTADQIAAVQRHAQSWATLVQGLQALSGAIGLTD